MPFEDRRIAIVHSEASRENFYDDFAYNQLYAAMQNQAMMAGLPFDLLKEEDLLDTARLLKYDAVLLPQLSHVKRQNRAGIKNSLLQLQVAGVSIITSGEIMSFDDSGRYYNDSSELLSEVLGVRVADYLSGVPATVNVTAVDHPATKNYTAGEQLVAYTELWFGAFLPADAEQSTVLTTVSVSGETFPGLQVIERSGGGHIVHFANDQIMADNNLLWSVLQWVVFGDGAPATLQLTRDESVFIARNDMDLAMMASTLFETEIPLLNIIRDWKRDYGFVGSYYIDIGDNPSAGQYTDWGISAPLYQQYIALGNEIGTHSWTHPYFTSTLTDAQLEFEFNQSKIKIGTELGIEVTGGAIPGNAEDLRVVENLNQWFKYFSGRSGTVGSGYQGAIGFLEPQHDMLYFSLNMSPDFTLIDYLDKTPAQARDIWRSEIDQLLVHAEKPILHWLWHDYGPTTQAAAGLYTKAMFEDTIAYAQSKGTEFTTLDNLHDRIRSFQKTGLSVGAGSTIDVTVDSLDVGQLSVKLGGSNTIQSVQNWYAYDDNQVFLPDAGGSFSITPGTIPDAVTRITKLPMRARLISLSGDGNELNFVFAGEGEVSVVLSPGMTNNALVSGASSFIESQDTLTLKFDSAATHTVSITAVQAINRAPQATPIAVQADTLEVVPVVLTGSDPDGDVLSFVVQNQPRFGLLTGTPPDMSYVSDIGFSGLDTFTYVASDGVLDSTAVTGEITVRLPRPANSAPVANRQVLATVINQPLSFLLSGSDNESQPLSYNQLTAPANGVVTGTAPDLMYTPQNDFFGIDRMTFVVSDGDKVSEPAEVVFNVEPQLSAGGGTVSNDLSGAVVDGTFNEWQNTRSFGTDPDDTSGGDNRINWKEAWMGHDADNIYIAYTQYVPGRLTWGHSIFIDTDTSDSTGFRGFGDEYSIGADYLIEGNVLFRYTGNTQNQWSWAADATGAVSSVVGDRVELSVARDQIGNPTNMRLFFDGENSATGGTELDYFPDDVTNDQAILKNRRFSYSVEPNQNIENVAPVANAQEVSISNNATLALVLSGSDLNGDTLTYQISRASRNGIVTGTPPELVYRPDPGYLGSDSFEFIVNDGSLNSNPAIVLFNVVAPPPVNSKPVANDQLLSTPSATPVAVDLTGSDADGGVLSYMIVAPPSNGALSGAVPNLLYTPDSGFTGVDSFTFKVNDGADDSAIATVDITVVQDGTNNRPVADAQNVSTAFETAIGIVLTGSDADNQTITFAIVGQPTAGILQGTLPNLTYVPFNGTSGVDTFSFTVDDGNDTSDAAVISINVQPAPPVNLAPIANGQTLSTLFAQPIDITLTAVDPESEALAYSIVGSPVSGSLSGTAPELTYTPGDNFTGLDSFRFVASDGSLNSAEATVTINVGTRPDGAVSNPVGSIVIDGLLDDWNGLTSFGLDPDDVSGPGNLLDWREAQVAHSATDLYISYRNDQAFQLSWGQGIYIDTDNNPNTGFKGFSGEFPIGADFLIEAYDVHRYVGDGQNWAWSSAGSTSIAANSDTGEIAVPRSMLGNPTDLKFYFRATNTPFGGTGVDHYPDAAIDPDAPLNSRSLHYTTVP